jgi:RNA polymerase sigma factor FliA
MTTTMMSSERADWRRYRRTGDVDARNRLVVRHMPLVYHFAGRMRARTGGALDPDELVSAGMVGLLGAVTSFDPDRGYRFSTYAAARIRGAMLDELRRRDLAPRSVRRRERQMERAARRLAQDLDRRPDPPELARVLGVDMQTLWRWKWDVDRSRPVSLSRVAAPGDARMAGLEREPVQEGEGVEDRLTREAEVRRLRQELACLKERERLVIELYDMGALTLREIAARLGVTESRVSQIRTRALSRLRDRMRGLREAA